MKTKILIDASTVNEQVDGLSIYIINLIRFLPQESFEEFDYTIVIQKDIVRPELRQLLDPAKFTMLELKTATIGPKRDWDMYWFLRKYRKKFDVIHIPSNWYPITLKGGICTIHDITFKKYFDSPRFTFRFAQWYMDFVTKKSFKNTAAIITVSAATKKELITTFNLPEKIAAKMIVIHEGWEHLMSRPADRVDCLLEIVPPDTKFLFYLGSSRKHKNISNLLSAFRLAMPNIPGEIKLVISGNAKFIDNIDEAVFREINKNEQRVIFTGYLSESCVEKLFRDSSAYILPSLSEGFGLPILEAFYYGKPVLCSNLTSLPEVAGDAAMYFDPFDPQDIANAIIRLYTDEAINVKLIEAGRNRLNYFSWKKAADETLAVYRSVNKKENR